MALSDDNNTGMVMPVQPMGGGYGVPYGGMGNGLGNLFGGDGAWLILLLLLCGGGWGGLGGLGMGGMMWPMMMGGMGAGFGLDYLYPWLNNSQNINDGFREQMNNAAIQGIADRINSGFGDVQLGIAGINQGVSSAAAGINQNLCSGFAGVNAAIANSAAQGEIAANGRHSALTGQLFNSEINALNRSFAEQTANQQGFNGLQRQFADCCCENRLANCQTQNVIQSEAAASRYASANETRDIIENQTRGTQAILDKLCALELDTVKSQLAQAQRENVALQNAVNLSAMRESQTAQTAQILAGQAAEIDGVYNRLKNCPVPSMPVYGNTPIFTCNGGYNGGCNCGCNA